MFRQSKLLKKIREGGVARVCSTGTNAVYYPALAAHFGYDAVWVDAEHRVWEPREVREMVLRHHLAGVDCIFRPSSTEGTALSRVLEDGVTALLIPMVNTAERARDLVAFTKFPPLGDRGLDGSGLDAGFSVGRLPDYTARANAETALIALIESPLGVENVEAIAAVEGVDLVFVGPGDLSLRLGCKNSLGEPKVRAAFEAVAAACKRQGKPWGGPAGTIEDAKLLIELGAQFVNFGSEFGGVMKHLEACSAQWNAQNLGQVRL